MPVLYERFLGTVNLLKVIDADHRLQYHYVCFSNQGKPITTLQIKSAEFIAQKAAKETGHRIRIIVFENFGCESQNLYYDNLDALLEGRKHVPDTEAEGGPLLDQGAHSPVGDRPVVRHDLQMEPRNRGHKNRRGRRRRH